MTPEQIKQYLGSIVYMEKQVYIQKNLIDELEDRKSRLNFDKKEFVKPTFYSTYEESAKFNNPSDLLSAFIGTISSAFLPLLLAGVCNDSSMVCDVSKR